MPINIYTKTLLYVDVDSTRSVTVPLFLTASKSILQSHVVPNYAMAQHAWRWKGNEKLKLFTHHSPDALQFAKRLVLLTVSADVVASCFDHLATTTPHFLKTLKVLEICANKATECELLTNKVLKHLPEMSSLESLNLFGFNDNALGHLKNISSPVFSSLNLSDCKNVTDSGLECLQKLIGLKVLNLNDNSKITNKTLSFLQNMNHNLQTLSLSRCENITNDGMSFLKDFSALQSLTLDFCPEISGNGLSNLVHNEHDDDDNNNNNKNETQIVSGVERNKKNVSATMVAGAAGSVVSDDGCTVSASIATQKKFRNNDNNNNNSGDGGAVATGGNNKKNKNNSVVGASYNTSEGSSTSMRTATVNEGRANGNVRASDDEDDDPIDNENRERAQQQQQQQEQGPTCLKSLHLSSCTKVDNEALSQIGKLIALNTLSLAFCPLITSEGISKSFKKLSVLENLDLRYCEQDIGDDRSLFCIGRYLISLKALNLYKCASVTDNGLAFLRHLPSLQYLNISKCHLVTDRGIYNLIFGHQQNNNSNNDNQDDSNSHATGKLGGCDNDNNNNNTNGEGASSASMLNSSYDPPTITDDKNNQNPNININHQQQQLFSSSSSSSSLITNSALIVLHVSDCKLLTDLTLNNLHALPTLRFLNIVYCDKITQVAKESLERAVPRINISHSIIPQNLKTMMAKQQIAQQVQNVIGARRV